MIMIKRQYEWRSVHSPTGIIQLYKVKSYFGGVLGNTFLVETNKNLWPMSAHFHHQIITSTGNEE